MSSKSVIANYMSVMIHNFLNQKNEKFERPSKILPIASRFLRGFLVS